MRTSKKPNPLNYKKAVSRIEKENSVFLKKQKIIDLLYLVVVLRG